MAGTMAASSAAVLSSLSQQIEQQSSSRAVVEDRHQNGAQAAVASDPAASHADRLAVKLGVFGLDICQAFNLRWYGIVKRVLHADNTHLQLFMHMQIDQLRAFSGSELAGHMHLPRTEGASRTLSCRWGLSLQPAHASRTTLRLSGTAGRCAS